MNTGNSRLYRAGRAVATLLVLAAGILHCSKRRGERATDRSRAIIHGASEAIISTDAAQTIVQANPAAAAMFGTSVQAMQGVPLATFIAPDLRLAASADAGARTAGRRASDDRVTGLRANGERFPLEGSISTLIDRQQTIRTIILRDISARQHIQQRLEQSFAQQRQLSAALQTIREEERTHIARELHDDLGQLLATLRLDLTLLRQHAPSDPVADRLSQRMDDLIISAITSLRRIASNLRPRALDEGGLYFALQSLRAEFVARHPIRFDLLADEADLALDDARSTAIFRIVQESLTNITRHAQANHVSVALQRIDSKLNISIQDDGRGIEEGDLDKASSFGLLGMRERVWALRGEIAVNAAGKGGTRIDIVLPLPPAAG